MDIKAAGTALVKGSYDSIRGISAVFKMEDEIEVKRNMSPFRNSNIKASFRDRTKQSPVKRKGQSKVWTRICHCSFMNGGVFLFSIFLFNYVLLPCLNSSIHYIFGNDSFMARLTWLWIEPILSLTFATIWTAPLFLLSKAVNSLWFQDIADSAYRSSRGKPPSWQSVSVWIADSIFSVAVQLLFLIQTMLVSYVPIYPLGSVFSLVHMSLLYSLYAFEYKWFNMGWELHRRLAYIERNWPYFIGFGLPLAVITQLPSSWVLSGGLFSLLFPFFIVSGNEANPVDDVGIYPLRLFSPVIAVSNMIFARTIGKKHISQKSGNVANLRQKFNQE
ncbi:hypothetical protein HHI36_011124 [Cryptolaemus montrouzieri]|uniref:Uncharacterized protein n=1 Tax=Cryptolaemus montrouzieri TaxID=559131 RepID=A0ABD2MKW1_9CUCU